MKNVLKGLLVGMVIGCLVNGVSVKAEYINSIDDNIKDYYTMQNGDVKTIYNDGSFYINSDVTIESMDKINDTITFNKDGQLYSFYVDKNEIDNYYIDEQINVTMDNNNNKVVDCIVDNEPVMYKNISIISKDNSLVYVNINDNKYAFDNEDDGWQTDDKVNVVIQNDKILEVRPCLDK